jgi:hypothetical protein
VNEAGNGAEIRFTVVNLAHTQAPAGRTVELLRMQGYLHLVYVNTVVRFNAQLPDNH